MRLQKFLARAGVASRRHAEKLIEQGKVTVNGICITEMGTQVDPEVDEVCVEGNVVQLPEEHITLMLHKPAGYVTTMNDPQGRPTVAELVDTTSYPGLFPVGRLDADTTGLLLFTNDGELGHGLLHPRRHVVKTYYALVEGALTEEEAATLRQGIELDDGLTLPAGVRILNGSEAQQAAQLIGTDAEASGYLQRHGGKRAKAVLAKQGTYVEVKLREGRKRQVRRMFQAVGHPVISLHRETFGSVELGGLQRGSMRILSAEEVARLKAAASLVESVNL